MSKRLFTAAVTSASLGRVAAAPASCWPRFKTPPAPYYATDLNGIALPDVCLDKPEPHHVFVLGDWGGIIHAPGTPPVPADHRSRSFNLHHRDFINGVDDSAQQRVAAQMKERAKKSWPDYLLNVGDTFYWAGVNASCGKRPFEKQDETGQWGPIFEDIYRGDGLDGLQWLGVLGNHDYGGFKFTMAWDQTIARTWHGSTDNWVMPAQYWKVKVNYPGFSVDFYFLDSNIFDTFDPHQNMNHNICGLLHNPVDASCGAQGPVSLCDCPRWFAELWEAQGRWLEKHLSESQSDWQILVTHFPPDYGEKYWIHLAKVYGIDLIVSGHRHTQEVHEWGPFNLLNATTWLVSGGGGGVTSEQVPHESGKDDQYGFMDLTLSRDTIRVEAISHGGVVRRDYLAKRRQPDPSHKQPLDWKIELKECRSVSSKNNTPSNRDIFLGVYEA